MTPREKISRPLPSEVVDKIQAVIDAARAEYDGRDFDFLAVPIDPGPSIEEQMAAEAIGGECEWRKLTRGSDEWRAAVDDQLEIREWYDHIAREKYDYNEVLLVSFADDIEEAAREILEEYYYSEDIDVNEEYADELAKAVSDDMDNTIPRMLAASAAAPNE